MIPATYQIIRTIQKSTYFNTVINSYGRHYAGKKSLESYIYLNQKGFLEKSREVG